MSRLKRKLKERKEYDHSKERKRPMWGFYHSVYVGEVTKAIKTCFQIILISFGIMSRFVVVFLLEVPEQRKDSVQV